MSNSVTGTTFAQIMERVVQASQNDFEESGVEQQTLQEMKEIWQKKLSALHVAQMPWDPVPPPPQINNPPTVPSNDSKQLPAPASAAPNPNYAAAVRVKQEPGSGYEPTMPGYQMNGYAMPNTNMAQQRAAALLQQNFGTQAQASIASAYPNQNNVALPGQQQRPMTLQLPQNRQHQQQHQHQQQQQHHHQQQHQQHHQQQHQQQQHQQQQPPPTQSQQHHPSSVYAAQTDGAGDAGEAEWRALVAARRSHLDGGPDGRLAADGMLRAQFEQRFSVIESGLMQPIEELSSSRSKQRKAKASGRPVARSSSIPQLDGEMGADEDIKPEENDDEAINSDLDDSDEEQLQGEEDEGPQGDTMICTYDKVQRVKNKWKCTLKDGVLSTGGKDYLFHKAQGEFEW